MKLKMGITVQLNTYKNAAICLLKMSGSAVSGEYRSILSQHHKRWILRLAFKLMNGAADNNVELGIMALPEQRQYV